MNSNNSTNFATTDICDAHEELITKGLLRVCDPIFKSFGGLTNFRAQQSLLRYLKTIPGLEPYLMNPAREES
jgi:regulator of ribonuclease activity A